MFENSAKRVNQALQQLKARTADLHLAAERHVRILDPDATDSTYANYLTKMFGFHALFELAFARHGGLEAAGCATRFLEGYREDTGARWRQFALIAERVLHDDRALATATAGARQTFELLTAWLAEPAQEAAR